MRFHRPDRPDPDFIVSVWFCCVTLYIPMHALMYLLFDTVEDLCDVSNHGIP